MTSQKNYHLRYAGYLSLAGPPQPPSPAPLLPTQVSGGCLFPRDRRREGFWPYLAARRSDGGRAAAAPGLRLPAPGSAPLVRRPAPAATEDGAGGAARSSQAGEGMEKGKKKKKKGKKKKKKKARGRKPRGRAEGSGGRSWCLFGWEGKRGRGSACGAGRHIAPAAASSGRRARGRGAPHGDGAGEAAGPGGEAGTSGEVAAPRPKGRAARLAPCAPLHLRGRRDRAAAAGRESRCPAPPERSRGGRGAGNGVPTDRGLPAPLCPRPCLPAPLLRSALFLRDPPCPPPLDHSRSSGPQRPGEKHLPPLLVTLCSSLPSSFPSVLLWSLLARQKALCGGLSSLDHPLTLQQGPPQSFPLPHKRTR
nr:translation initiation factor IF-2-like [Taeniopygia guttata]